MYLEDTINSVVDQSYYFKKNVQLILIDNNSQDKSKDIALEFAKKYPDNILYLFNEDSSFFSSYNLALEHIEGQYVNFMGSIDQWSHNALKKASKFFSKNKDVDVVAFPIKYLDFEDRKYALDYKFEEETVVDLKDDPHFKQLDINSTFIRRDALFDGGKAIPFKNNFYFDDVIYVNEILLKNTKLGLVSNAYYLFRENFDDAYEIDKDFIFDSFNYFYNALINISNEMYGFVPGFIQNVMINFIAEIVRIPVLEEVIEDKEEIDRFWEEFSNILFFIDQNNILRYRGLGPLIKKFLVFVKNDDFNVEVQNKRVFIKTNDYVINNLIKHFIWIDIVDIKDGFLNISGSFTSNCDKKFLSVEGIKSANGISEIFEAESIPYLNSSRETIQYLSIPWHFVYSFDLKIPVKRKESCKITFRVLYTEGNYRIPFNGRLKFKSYADLSRFSHFTVKNNQLVLLRGHSFFIKPYSFKPTLKYEYEIVRKLFKLRPMHFLKATFYNGLYLLFYKYMKNKKIWIFSDRVDLCGDNGEHFFHYAIKQKDDIQKYFVIDKESEDYARLKRLYGKNIVPFGSFKHKFLFIFAKKFLQSQISPVTYNPFVPINQKLYAGMNRGKVYFLQHGVARYDMSSWVTKFDKDLSLILTVSDMDHKEFTSDNYNYDDDIVQTLGFPRFDNLSNDNLKKQIVIMPTWRNYIKTPNQLINSEYYHKFNNLLNNERLIEHAKEKGYEIMLKPHPLMYQFIDYFDTNPYVKVDNVTKHHDILCDSALMITDYSSVAFDFVYLKKPVIYYQYEGGEDHHFDISTVLADDDSMEFGPIIKDEDELIDKIIDYMDNNCKMEDFYINRVNNFFKYNDKNNSKRVYEWIKKH